jgi:hypothetical protein
MDRGIRRSWLAVAAAGVALGVATGVAAEEPQTDAELAAEDRIAELEKKVEVLAEELEKTRSESVVPETSALKSAFGLGPAASKVYQVTRGLSLGAYAEASYRNLVGDQQGAKDSTDFERLVIYTGYKFSDRILFNSEVEFEHGTTNSTLSSGGGSVSVEFANLDFMFIDELNARIGLLLLPMGFINEIHEPPYFHGVARPEVERQIIPSTWRENGAGIFGTLFADQVEYRLYVVNGLTAEGYDSTGLRAGRQSGNRAIAEHGAVTGRVDWIPIEGLLIGASAFHGNSGQNQTISAVSLPDTPTTIWDAHAEFERWGLHLRALVTMAHLGDAGRLTTALRLIPDGIGPSESIASEMIGAYGEVAYNVWPLIQPESEMRLEPFFRYEYLDTQLELPSGFSGNDAREIEIHTVGLSFKPIPQVVLKADYRSRDSKNGTRLADEFNVGIGLAF